MARRRRRRIPTAARAHACPGWGMTCRSPQRRSPYLHRDHRRPHPHDRLRAAATTNSAAARLPEATDAPSTMTTVSRRGSRSAMERQRQQRCCKLPGDYSENDSDAAEVAEGAAPRPVYICAGCVHAHARTSYAYVLHTSKQITRTARDHRSCRRRSQDRHLHHTDGGLPQCPFTVHYCCQEPATTRGGSVRHEQARKGVPCTAMHAALARAHVLLGPASKLREIGETCVCADASLLPAGRCCNPTKTRRLPLPRQQHWDTHLDDQAAGTSDSAKAARDHASPIYCYHDNYAVRDRRGQTTRAGAADVPAALHQLMDTDEAMDDVDAHIYTTTIIMHGEREAKTENDDHSSRIGSTPASRSCGGN
jgi:hypothetical protein